MTDATIWVVRRKDAVTGFLATLALTSEGVTALLDGRFDAGKHRTRNGSRRMGEPLAGLVLLVLCGKGPGEPRRRSSSPCAR